jgi:hypothetical protein
MFLVLLAGWWMGLVDLLLPWWVMRDAALAAWNSSVEDEDEDAFWCCALFFHIRYVKKNSPKTFPLLHPLANTLISFAT